MGNLTQGRLRQLLSYNRDTGEFIWLFTRNTRLSVGDTAGATDDKGYRTIGVDGRIYKAHRLAWLYAHGEWPKGHIDHIDGNPGNNAIANLRDVSQSENMRNARLYANNKSGVSGVSWAGRRGAWAVGIRVAGKRKYLGYRESFFEACCLRKSAENKYGFHRNHGRAA